MTAHAEGLLEIDDLVVATGGRHPTAVVDHVRLSLGRGEILGVVGESGSGKTTLALSIIDLLPSGMTRTGSIQFENRELIGLSSTAIRDLRATAIAMIFQNPFRSLNPTLRIGQQVGEALEVHHGLDRSVARLEAIRLLDEVEIPNARDRVDDYPHQLSGGMQQRAMIAMAISCQPRLLIADEPTTALDVTVQARLLELLLRLVEEHRMSMLIISHDFGVISAVADRVAVMYAGEVVETADAASMASVPRHPYARALLESIPSVTERRQGAMPSIPGRPPDLRARGIGCRFAPRCAYAIATCHATRPEIASGARSGVACHVRPWGAPNDAKFTAAASDD